MKEMYKYIIVGVSALVLTSLSFAGPTGYSGKNVVIDSAPIIEPEGCSECWEGNSVDVFAGYTVFDEDGGLDEDGVTAGIGVNHFFSQYLGLGLEAMWIDSKSIIHQLGANLIARLPIDLGSTCLAPYVLAGVGGHFDSVNQATAAAGGGLELLLPDMGCTGIFADGRYVFADETSDYTTVRLGIRKSF